jgi:hypothetical protein
MVMVGAALSREFIAFSAPAGKKIQMHGKTSKYKGMKRTYWYATMIYPVK